MTKNLQNHKTFFGKQILSFIMSVIFNPIDFRFERKTIEYYPVTKSSIPQLDVIGDDLTVNATLGLIKDNKGVRVRYETSVLVNSVAYVEGLTIHRRQYNSRLYCRFKITSLNSTRIFIGFTNKNASDHANSPDPTGGNYFGLLYDNAISPNWIIIMKNGSTQNLVNTGIPANTAVHEIILEMFSVNGPNAVQWQIDDNDTLSTQTNLPNDGTDLRFVAAALTKNSSVKGFELGKCSIDDEFDPIV